MFCHVLCSDVLLDGPGGLQTVGSWRRSRCEPAHILGPGRGIRARALRARPRQASAGAPVHPGAGKRLPECYVNEVLTRDYARSTCRAPRAGLWSALAALLALSAAAQDDDAADPPADPAADSAADEAADAVADSFDRTPERCVRLSRLNRTEVLDEQTILFHMYGGVTYRNHLPEECRGLNSREPFMYNTRSVSRELCANDMIDLLHGIGSSLRRGRSCLLGQFHPITPEDIEEIKNVPRRPGIVVEPVELPPDDAEEADRSAQPELSPAPGN